MFVIIIVISYDWERTILENISFSRSSASLYLHILQHERYKLYKRN